MGCAQTPQTQCEFPLKMQGRRWTILLRVRAELGALTSAWAHTPPFVAERDSGCSLACQPLSEGISLGKTVVPV